MTTLSKIFGAIGLFRKAFSRHIKKLALMTFLGFVGGLLGGIGVGAVIPLFYLVTNQSGIGTDPISQIIAQTFDYLHLPLTLPAIIILIIFLFVAKSIFLYAANYLNSRIYADYERETRSRLFQKTLEADWPYLMRQKTGYLGNVLMGDVSGASSALNNFSAAILTGTSLVTYAIVAINISVPITLFTLGLGFLLFLLFKPLFYKIRQLSRKTSETGKKLAHHLNQHLLGSKIIKSMSLEDEVLDQGNLYFEDLRNTQLKQLKYGVLFNIFLEPLSLLFIVIIFLASYRNPAFNVATFVAIIYLVQKMFTFVQSIQTKFNGLNAALPLMNIMVGYEKEVDKNREFTGGNKEFIFNQTLEFNHVSFAYTEGQTIINSLNLSINKGETVGIIGPSGVGKTTVIDLLLRLLRPQEGEILIDGVKIDEIDQKIWRNNVGYVSQDIFLLNDTIENNILFFHPSLNHHDLIEASKLANIHDFIETLPDKFQTPVGERGIQLSVGQRQRIVLARILARKPPLLVLDEATSALDNESEHKIQEAIKNLQGKLTLLIVAHRLSTVMHADKIFVLQDGKIKEEGRPRELLENKQSYFYKNYHLNENQ